jgi:hypothetical protein
VEDKNLNAKIVAGLVAVGLGVALFLYYADNDDKDSAKVACTLTASGVTAIATGLSRGQNAQAIIAIAGPSLGTLACSNLVNSLISKPATPIPVKVQLGAAGTRASTVTAQNFLLPSPARQQTCLDWIDDRLKAQCLFGEISPPPF